MYFQIPYLVLNPASEVSHRGGKRYSGEMHGVILGVRWGGLG